MRGVQHEGHTQGSELLAQVTVVVIEHGGRKIGNAGQVRMGVPRHYDFGPLCLKRSSQAVRDNPGPLHDQYDATLKGIVIVHCRWKPIAPRTLVPDRDRSGTNGSSDYSLVV